MWESISMNREGQPARALSSQSGELRINWGVSIFLTAVFVIIGVVLITGVIGGSAGRSTTLPLGIAFVVLPFALIIPGVLIIRHQRERRARLETAGIQATAKILSISTTGSEFGVGNYGAKMLLEITPPDGSPYQVKKRMYLNVADFAAFQQGAVLPILIDPKNPRKFIFGAGARLSPTALTTAAWGSTPGGSPLAQAHPQFIQGQQAIDLLKSLGLGNLATGAGNVSVNVNPDESIADLQNAQRTGGLAPDGQVVYSASPAGEEQSKIQEIIDQADYEVLANGVTANATILTVNDMGIKVAGNNPAMKMRVEVFPEKHDPFTAEVAGFVNEASVHKLQPGRKLLVKFDPSDTSKVAIYHTAPDEPAEEPRVIE